MKTLLEDYHEYIDRCYPPCERRKVETDIISDLILELTTFIKILPKYQKRIYGYVQQFGFDRVYSATELSFKKYYNPYGEPWEEMDSFENAMDKIGGICYNWQIQGV